MNDVEELKQYIGVHAKGQDIPDLEGLLARIRTDTAGPGSWAGEWTAAGDRWAERGRHLEASRHYIMARFPYVDGAARQEAYEKSLDAFERWSADQDLHRFDVDVDGRKVGCWQSGLSEGGSRPLVVVTGGFLTVKEQWAPTLQVFRRLGLAAVATEMPGVGENEVPYDAGSWRYLSAVIDAVAGQADTSRTCAVALSFSGHQALRCAMVDPRITGVITVGAPVHDFFTDMAWQKGLPRITVDTLAHLSGGELADMADRALSPSSLDVLEAQVGYVASLRDEVIPQADPRLLQEHVRHLHLLEHDDVHGSPGHVRETQLWLTRTLLRMQGVQGAGSLLVGLMWTMARARSRLAAR